MQFEIEISSPSTEVVNALERSTNAQNVSIEHNFTGEVIVVLTTALPLATELIRQIGAITRDKQKTIRSQKIKSNTGSIQIEGYNLDDTLLIIEALQGLHLENDHKV